VFVVVPVVIRHSPPSGFHGYWVRIEIVFVALSFVLDLLLTFVMPALVFTTGNPFTATRIGFRYLHRVWGSVKWHALVPPTAILAIGQLADGSVRAAFFGIGLSVTGAMLGLLFKGAQLRAYFDYADQLDVSIDGFTRWTPASSSRPLRKRPTRQQRADAAKAYEARWPS
jgi:hypothetical protein